YPPAPTRQPISSGYTLQSALGDYDAAPTAQAAAFEQPPPHRSRPPSGPRTVSPRRPPWTFPHMEQPAPSSGFLPFRISQPAETSGEPSFTCRTPTEAASCCQRETSSSSSYWSHTSKSGKVTPRSPPRANSRSSTASGSCTMSPPQAGTPPWMDMLTLPPVISSAHQPDASSNNQEPPVPFAQGGILGVQVGKTVPRKISPRRTTSESRPLFSSPRRRPGPPISPSLQQTVVPLPPSRPQELAAPPDCQPLANYLATQEAIPQNFSLMWYVSRTSWLKRCLWLGFPCSNPRSPDQFPSPDKTRILRTPTKLRLSVSYDTSRATSPPSPLKRASTDR
ncbi:unnamed protein product, partial [Ixodes pacificus]